MPSRKRSRKLSRQSPGAKNGKKPGRQSGGARKAAGRAQDAIKSAGGTKDTIRSAGRVEGPTEGEERSRAAGRTRWRSRLTRGWVLASGAFLFVGAVVSFISDLGGIRSAWLDSKEPPLALAFYEQDGDRLELTGQQLAVDVTPDDVFSDRLRFPVRIAVSNRDDRRLDVVRVTLKYPAYLEVTSAGRAQIDPTGRTVTYEHDIGVLEAVDGFTPIAPLDEVVVPFAFVEVPTVFLSREGVPMYELGIAGTENLPVEEGGIPIDITVQASDRPAVHAVVYYGVEPGFELVPQGTGKAISRSVTVAEAASFTPPVGPPVVEWSGEVNEQGNVVRYRKYESSAGTVQVVFVDGVLRRQITDADGDGNIDNELIDENGDGTADVFVTFTGERWLVDWPAEAAQR